jgi:hypothetical protein
VEQHSTFSGPLKRKVESTRERKSGPFQDPKKGRLGHEEVLCLVLKVKPVPGYLCQYSGVI